MWVILLLALVLMVVASAAFASDRSKTRIFLEADDNFTVSNSGNFIYGSNGRSTVTISSGVSGVTLDQNIGQINFLSPSSSYTFKQTGNIINIYDSTGTSLIVSAPVRGDNGTQLYFSNGTASAKINSGTMTLGGVTVSYSTATALNEAISAGTFSITNTTKAKVFLGADVTYTVSNIGEMLYGNTGSEVVNIKANISGVTLDQNIGQINLTDATSNYTFRQTGNIINVYDAAGITLLLRAPVQGTPVGTVFSFSNVLVSARLTSGVMTLGSAQISSGVPTAITLLDSITQVQAARFLQQASLVSNESAIAQVVALGFLGWLDTQFNIPRSQSRWDWMVGRGYQNDPNNANGFAGVDNVLWLKLISSSDPLRQRIALALSEIFVVSMAGLPVPWRGFCIAAYMDLLEQYAFDNYRTLLGAVTLSTAMGNYLSMRGNQKEDLTTGRHPDENYAREILQLFSIGLYELNNDGSLKLDNNGKPVETYSQDTITGLAKVFTGWDYTGYTSTAPDCQQKPMSFITSRFSTADKSFLGTTISGAISGTNALNMALDAIFNHPNVGPFIGRQLIQRLVTSNPSPYYIGRVANAFNDNGSGVRGDLKAVIKAILLDPEARTEPSTQTQDWGKLREPIIRFVQWARTFGATSPTGIWNIGNTSEPSTRLGQSPMRSPTVFNFFRPNYIPPNTLLGAQGMVAPELQITNESTVVAYINFMQTVISSGIGEVIADYSGWLSQANDPAELVAKLNLQLTAGQLSDTTVSIISSAISSISATTDSARLKRIYAATLLTMASPEYLVLK